MKHSSPNDSSAHRLMRQEAVKCGFHEDVVRQLLWLINAHDQLPCFIKISENLKIILNLLPHHTGISLKEFGIDKWPSLTEWIVSNSDHLEKLIGGHFNRQPKDELHNPLLGQGAQRHGLYTALWSTATTGELKERFSLALGHFLLAHIRLLKTDNRISLSDYEAYSGPSEIPGFPNSPYGASLALRRLSKEENAKELRMLNPYVSPEDFAAHVNSLAHTPTVMGSLELGGYCRFIPKPYGLRTWSQRRGSGGGGGGRWQPGNVKIDTVQEILPVDVGDPDDPYEDWGAQQLLTEIIRSGAPIDESEYENLLDDDVAPSELAGPDELYLTKYPCEETKKGIAGFVFAARGQVRHTTMENQLLPWRYRQLTITELCKLLTLLSPKFKALLEKSNWDKNDSLVAESIALIHTMLWTGSDLERAQHLKIQHAKTGLDVELALYAPDHKKTRNQTPIVEWCVKSYVPQYRRELTAPEDIIRPRHRHVFLPDLAGGAQFILQLLERPKYANELTPFKRQLAAYRQCIKTLLLEIDPSGRLNEHKITNYVFHRICIISGDITQAVTLTGQEHVLAQTRMFYSTPQIDLLRQTYVKSVTQIVDDVYRAADRHVPSPYADVPTAGNRHVGSRACATVSAVKAAIRKLQDAIEGAKHFDSWSKFVEYHNLYTLYTVQMFGYATACRAIITPFLSSIEIDGETGLSALADKDGPDHHKSRLVWVPDGVMQQIQCYESHAQVCRGQRHTLFTNAPEQEKYLDCFFIDPDRNTYELIRPKTLTPRLAGYLALPANSHRRFMRTELMEKFCPAEVIDAFMGHWNRGEEPWGKYSSFSFADYVASLRQHLVPLLHELGWKPIKSELCR